MIRLLAAVALTLPLVSTAVAAERTFDLAVVRGRLSGSPATIHVHQGDSVVLRWHSDRPVTLHLHGYDIKTRVVPGAVAETRFEARATGRFPVHLHESRARSETVLVYLEVYPE
jgi:hypothetical protein